MCTHVDRDGMVDCPSAIPTNWSAIYAAHSELVRELRAGRAKILFLSDSADATGGRTLRPSSRDLRELSPVYLQIRAALDVLPAIQLAKCMIETGPHIPSEPQGGLDARFCEAMDAVPMMIWVSGEDKLCIWFNRPWLEFTGRAMAQELGNGWAEGVHPEDFDRCLGIYVSHFEARQKFRMQYRLRRHDGEYRWIDDTGIPRYAHDGSFLGYFGSCTDVHDQKATEAELRKLKETLEQRIGETTTRLETELSVSQPDRARIGAKLGTACGYGPRHQGLRHLYARSGRPRDQLE